MFAYGDSGRPLARRVQAPPIPPALQFPGSRRRGQVIGFLRLCSHTFLMTLFSLRVKAGINLSCKINRKFTNIFEKTKPLKWLLKEGSSGGDRRTRSTAERPRSLPRRVWASLCDYGSSTTGALAEESVTRDRTPKQAPARRQGSRRRGRSALHAARDTSVRSGVCSGPRRARGHCPSPSVQTGPHSSLGWQLAALAPERARKPGRSSNPRCSPTSVW